MGLRATNLISLDYLYLFVIFTIFFIMKSFENKLKKKGESYVNEVIVDGLKLGEVSKKAMDEKLHRNIVYIFWKNHQFNQYGRGTGLLISSDLILTCAHNLYNTCFQLVPKESFEIYRAPCSPLPDLPYKA